MDYHYAGYPLWKKFEKEDWVNHILGYLLDRFTPLEERLKQTFRYVDCDSRNLGTSSYEYSSIVRDAGSIFGSAMDQLLLKTNAQPLNNQKFTIRDYKKWLVENVPNIHELSLELPIQRTKRYLIPFVSLKNLDEKLCWWDAYNDLKHSDFENYPKGNLQNAINGAAAVASLFMLMADSNPAEYVSIFSDLGTRTPPDELQQLLFCAS